MAGRGEAQNAPVMDYYLVLDFEATCEKHKKIVPQEIIEFPVLKVNARTLKNGGRIPHLCQANGSYATHSVLHGTHGNHARHGGRSARIERRFGFVPRMDEQKRFARPQRKILFRNVR